MEPSLTIDYEERGLNLKGFILLEDRVWVQVYTDVLSTVYWQPKKYNKTVK